MSAFRAFRRFRGASRLGTWLYRIAYNACLDELERSRRVVQSPLDELPERVSPEPGVAATVVRRRDLAEALAELPLKVDPAKGLL